MVSIKITQLSSKSHEFIGKFYQMFKKELALILYNLFHNEGPEETLYMSFYKLETYSYQIHADGPRKPQAIL